MSFLRQMIERKISAAAGAAVTFEEFRFSPLSGTIEIKGVKVAVPRFATPMLTADRILAKVVVARALKQEIVLKSLAIENPVLSIVYRSDGSLNIEETRRARAATHELKDAGGAWEFECDKVLIVGGQIVFRDTRRERYTIALEGINASLAPEAQDLAITLTADALGRRDKPLELGAVKLSGKLTGAAKLKNLDTAALQLDGSIDQVAIGIASTLVSNRVFDIDLSGAMPLAKLVGLMPSKRAFAYDISGGDSLEFKARLTLDGHRTIRIARLEFKTTDVTLNRPTG
jgi:uncharacterized protein involved in outer membrane biogenesis